LKFTAVPLKLGIHSFVIATNDKTCLDTNRCMLDVLQNLFMILQIHFLFSSFPSSSFVFQERALFTLHSILSGTYRHLPPSTSLMALSLLSICVRVRHFVIFQVITKFSIKSINFWHVTPYGLVYVRHVSEECTASIFRTEVQAVQASCNIDEGQYVAPKLP
jgi:hypothetical protein